MFVTPEQILEAHKANLDSLINLSNKAFANVEKAVELNLSTLKSTLEENAEKAKELLAIKDLQELVNLQTSFAQPAAEKVASYSKAVYDLAASAAAEVQKLAEAQLAEANKKLATFVDSAAKSAPAGSEPAVALVKSALSAANNAYESFSKASKQAVELAEANLSAATNATLKAAAPVVASTRSSKKVA